MQYMLLIFLFICAIYDIHFRKIPAVWIWFCILVMIGYQLYLLVNGENTISDLVLSIMPGVMIYLFSYISNEIGKGDGLLIIATGCFFPWKIQLGILMTAFFLAAVFSIGFVMTKHNFKNKRIPFVPFLFVATGISLMGVLA